MPSSSLLSVARGEIPADLLLKNARLVNVFSGVIDQTDIAIHGDRIAAIGPGYAARKSIDLKNAYVAPGLIDGHVHIESSLCLPGEFAAAIVPRGVTTAVTDPHEIANVAGAAGVRFMADASRGLPLRVITMASSCVPATNMATTGATLTADDLQQLLRDGVVHGLAEVMNFPGVIAGDASVLAKLDAFKHRPIDGHAPGVHGHALNAYLAAGVGSDHECVTADEAREKLSRGMFILIREATNARNLDALLPLITPENSRRIGFCTDDRTPPDLLRDGSIDMMLRRAIASGVDPVTAIRCCTLNTAEWFRLHDRGAIAPGRFADLFVFDDLNSPKAKAVFAGGKIVAENGHLRSDSIPVACSVPPALLQTVNLHLPSIDLTVMARPGKLRVIESQANQLVTKISVVDALLSNDAVVADPARDLLKIAVIERHTGGGRTGLAFIRGFGLKRGAIAGTVAHDHHNLIVIGADDASMRTAVSAVAHADGGYAVADGSIATVLALPVAGLMSELAITAVARQYNLLLARAAELGATPDDPFMAMSFMALEVIPSLKLTDQGLVDVDAFRHVELFV